jgi:hypothetical protein
MRDFERRQHLLDFNPWWQNPGGWEQNDPDLREARGNALGSYDPRPLSDIEPGASTDYVPPSTPGEPLPPTMGPHPSKGHRASSTSSTP